MQRVVTVLAAGALPAFVAVAAPATPTPKPSNITVSIAGFDMTIALPEGMCAPTGDAAAVAEANAALDTHNLTLATLVDCRPGKQPFDEYYVFKASRSNLSAEIDRADFRNRIGPAFAVVDWDAVAAHGTAAANAQLNGSIKIEPGQLTPLGQDDVCAYIAGGGEISAGSQKARFTAIGCLTVVRRKLLSIYKYSTWSGNNLTVEMIMNVKAVAKRMIADNE